MRYTAGDFGGGAIYILLPFIEMDCFGLDKSYWELKNKRTIEGQVEGELVSGTLESVIISHRRRTCRNLINWFQMP